MADQRPSYPKPDWNIWDFQRFSLRGIPRSDRTAATLKFKVVNGNPRFTMYTNKEGSTGSFSAKIEPRDMFALFELLRRVSKSKEPNSFSCRIKESFIGGKRQEKPVETSRLTVGLDEAGWTFISLQPYKQEVEIFRFKDHHYAVWVGETGEPVSPRILSAAYANGWCNLLESMIGPWLVAKMTTDPNAKKDRSPGSEYDKQHPVNKPESTSNSGWGASGDFDDDIPEFD